MLIAVQIIIFNVMAHVHYGIRQNLFRVVQVSWGERERQNTLAYTAHLNLQ